MSETGSIGARVGNASAVQPKRAAAPRRTYPERADDEEDRDHPRHDNPPHPGTGKLIDRTA